MLRFIFGPRHNVFDLIVIAIVASLLEGPMEHSSTAHKAMLVGLVFVLGVLSANVQSKFER